MKDLQLKYKEDLFRFVLSEHTKQIEKWGVQDHDPFIWCNFLTEEVGEVARAISEWRFRGGDRIAVAKEAVQTATLALKIAEMFLFGGTVG